MDYLESIAISLFVDWLSLSNHKQIQYNPTKYNLMMRRAVLSRIIPHLYFLILTSNCTAKCSSWILNFLLSPLAAAATFCVTPSYQLQMFPTETEVCFGLLDKF